MHLGRDRVICAYELDGLIVDPGPTSSVETLLDRLGARGAAGAALTHIHLDHAGATGVLCRRFPELKVYVHERGAPHLVDPSKLLTSAERLYGDDMDAALGRGGAGAERAHPRRSRAARPSRASAWPTRPGTPRTTSATCTRSRATPTSGDIAGVRIPPHAHTVAPTPPPGHRPRAVARLAHTVACWSPQSLCLTHFGQVTDVTEQHRPRPLRAHRVGGPRAHGR